MIFGNDRPVGPVTFVGVGAGEYRGRDAHFQQLFSRAGHHQIDQRGIQNGGGRRHGLWQAGKGAHLQSHHRPHLGPHADNENTRTLQVEMSNILQKIGQERVAGTV